MNVPESKRTVILIMFIIFTVIQLGYACYVRVHKKSSSVDKYVSDFYTGGRGMGAVVIALIVAAGVAGAGIFMGMPGMGYTIGQVYIVCTIFSLVMNFGILGQIGKKIGIVARRANITSYIGIYRDRYENNKIYNYLASILCLAFMCLYTASTYAGGAKLFQAMTGQSYTIGLIVFTALILATTLLGGLSSVGNILVIQGAVMTCSIIVFFILGIHSVGNLEEVYRSLVHTSPEWFSNNNYHWTSALAYSLTLCFFLWSLPHSTMGTLAYKSTKALHGAIKVGLIIVFIWSMGLNLLIPVVKYKFPDLTNFVSADLGIPYLVIDTMPSWVAGLTLAGVSAAVQSSLNTMALVVCAIIVTDMFTFAKPKTKPATIRKVNIVVTILVSAVLFYLAFNPPPLLSVVALNAMGGLCVCFVPQLLLGLYWPRANVQGAIAGTIGGLIGFILMKAGMLGTWWPFEGEGFGLVCNVVLLVVVSLLTPKPMFETVKRWFCADFYTVQGTETPEISNQGDAI